METPEALPGAKTVSTYLAHENERIKTIVGLVASNVRAAAKQAAKALIGDRERVSDVADHLDGEFRTALGLDQVTEIREISAIGRELQRYFDTTVVKQAFGDFDRELVRRIRELEMREADLRERERNIDTIVKKRVAELRDEIQRDSTTARGFFESALAKSEKVFDQNKITRFAYSTVALFQEEFFELQGSTDVEHITKLYQRAIEPFQITKMVMDKDGKLKKVITNQFSEACSQDLFLFFYKYYNELVEIQQAEGELPPTADELARIFHKKKKAISEIIADMQQIDGDP